MKQVFILVCLVLCSFALASEVEQPKTPFCQPCQVGVNLVKDYLSQPDEELLKLLVKGCEMLPDQIQQPCRMAVVMLGGEILKFARETVKEPSKIVCGRLGLCRGVFPIRKQDSPLCPGCINGVTQVKNFLLLPDEELMKLVNQVCSYLPSQFQQQCVAAIKAYGGEVLKALRAVLDGKEPRQVCQALGVCGAGVASIDEVQKLKSHPIALKQDGRFCTPCLMAVQLIKDYLDKPDDELIEMLAQACDLLPDNVRTPCKAMVAVVGKQLIDYVRSNVNDSPRQICARWSLCSSKDSAKKFSQDGVFCTPCLMAVQLIKDYMGKPDNELIEMLAANCELLPDNLVTPCKAMVAVVGKQLIDYVRSHVNDSPREVCAYWSLCGANNLEKLIKDSFLCAPCQLGVQMIKDYLDKPDDELLKILVAYCDKLPEQLQTPCKIAFATLGPQLIAYVRSHVSDTPREICAKFRLCNAGALSFNPYIFAGKVATERLNIVECLKKCLKEWNVMKIIALVRKCKRDVNCYKQEVGADFQCVKNCLVR
eukprot:gene10439-2961_t